VATQIYISDYAQAHQHTPGAPRIPKVVFYFEVKTTGYLAMEYLQLAPSPPDLNKIEAALGWLSGVPPPPNHEIGPLGGGLIRHPLFNNDKAPLKFSSVEALGRYMNKVRPRLVFFSSIYHPLANSSATRGVAGPRCRAGKRWNL
jgi:hypothetical protein